MPIMGGRLTIILMSAITVVIGSAGDWPHWRGPDFNGITHESLPDELPDPVAEHPAHEEVSRKLAALTEAGETSG